jgi:hypothetical protein
MTAIFPKMTARFHYMSRILKEKYECHTKIYTDGFKKEEKVEYAVVWEEQTIKTKIHPQNSIYSTEHPAIIYAIIYNIYILYNSWKKKDRR